MISVESRDGRKGGLGLGFGSEGEMEETELEEGEACSYQNGDDDDEEDDSTIDPDALSYIDEKLQDVLGHFQKDFEGGVSAENLGAKFGGYGSFLPVHQRSPVASRPRTPSKAHNYNTPRSPNNLHLEGGHHSSEIPASASLSVRHGPSSVTSAMLSSLRATVKESSKRDVGMESAQAADEPTLRCESVKNCAQTSNQKTLKVRIKVGSDNLSTRNTAEIYSGLGLDISPSASLEDSPSDSEGFFREPLDAADESPTSILQIMTSFPVHGNLLLSPLPDDVIYLTEKEEPQGESKPRRKQKYGQERTNGSDTETANEKFSGGKKPKAVKKNVFSVELKNSTEKGTHNGIGVLLKKETDFDSSVCEATVATVLKLPLLSNSYSDDVYSGKGTGKAVDNSSSANKVKEEPLCDLAKGGDNLEAVFGLVEKPSGKAASAGKFVEDKKADFHIDISVYPRKDGNFKEEKADLISKAESIVSKGRKAQNAEPIDPLEQKAIKRSIPHEEDDMQVAFGEEHSYSGCKNKSQESQSHGAQCAEVPKDSSRMDSSFKNRKSTHANNHTSKFEVEDSKLQKDHGKARQIYSDLFGDIELEHADNNVVSAEMMSTDRPKHFETANSTSKERSNGKKMEKPPMSDAYFKSALNAAPITGNGPISDVAPGTVAPVVQEDWVCCDKCQKWRLLPLGTNPDSLPEKWLCSMLDWLPGMNRCSFSEEETTKALVALNQFPAPEGQNNQHGHPGGVQPGLSLADANGLDQNCQSIGFHAVPGVGKKKNGIKEVLAAENQDAPLQFSNDMKKNLQGSVKSRSLNGLNQSPPVNGIDSQFSSKYSVVEKHRKKQKEKNKLLEHHSDGGEIVSSKIRSKREGDQDRFRVSKKTKIDGMHHTEDWMPGHDGPIGKVVPSSSSALSVNASEKNGQKYDYHHSKDRKCEANNGSPLKYSKDQGLVTSDDGSPCMGTFIDKDARKRKMNRGQDTHVYTTPLLTGHHSDDRKDFLEETSANDHRKEKKAKVSKSEGKETSISKGSGGAAKKGRSTKDRHFRPDQGSTQRSLDATDSVGRDLGLRSAQPSQAATSSSSKVSGSHRNKANLKEVKGSPVESVSSSPLRFSNPDKSASARSLEGKDDSGDACLFATGTPRRCSDVEYERESDHSGRVRKGETFVTHHGTLESSMLDFQERDTGHLAGSEAKIQIVHSPEFTNPNFAYSGADTTGNGTQYPCEPRTSDHTNVSRPRKSGMGSSSESKERNGAFQSEKGNVRISDFCNQSIDHSPYGEKSRAGKNRIQEKFGVSSDKVENNLVGKKESAGKLSGENSKKETQLKIEGDHGLDGKVDALSSQDQKKNLRAGPDDRSSKRHLSGRKDQVEVSGRGKSQPLPPSGRGQNEIATHLDSGSRKEKGSDSLLVDASEGDDALKASEPIKRSEKQNGNVPTKSRDHTTNGHKVRDVDATSPVRRDSSNQAATNALKEAKDLKHLADRLKNSGSNAESRGIYFQAALKFLHGASLLESCNSESSKQREFIQSMQIYSSTAKLCEFCAREYEKSKDMAAASLAYKCMEVAYMRVIYSSHSGASKDRHELQNALRTVPHGESPSSSASDVDNLNHPTTLDKVPLANGVRSPQVAGNHVIAARHHTNLSRLLKFAQDVNFAMEASRKSQVAFAAANLRMEEAKYKDGITSVKKALDFNFQDVEVLLRLVRLAVEAISR